MKKKSYQSKYVEIFQTFCRKLHVNEQQKLHRNIETSHCVLLYWCLCVFIEWAREIGLDFESFAMVDGYHQWNDIQKPSKLFFIDVNTFADRSSKRKITTQFESLGHSFPEIANRTDTHQKKNTTPASVNMAFRGTPIHLSQHLHRHVHAQSIPTLERLHNKEK